MKANPGITTHVPLWLAIMLKQLNKCRIIAPTWLSVDYLTARLEREKASDVFEELPFHYLEIASLLFKKYPAAALVQPVVRESAPEDLEQGEHLRSLLEDLQNVRQDKIRNGLSKIAGDVQSGGTAYAIQMNNIAALEINSVRQFMIGVRSDLLFDSICEGTRKWEGVIVELSPALYGGITTNATLPASIMVGGDSFPDELRLGE
ncbi:hypothetical protein BBJ28_00007267 [Nothophytophthora sp. Chile5]|nr:hypothetical protein BBJ28_00007267 [Nothophytophthora sp. Chile5]